MYFITQISFYFLVVCVIRVSTEKDEGDLNLFQKFRTPKDFSRVNFDHFEILERNNFDSSPTTSQPETENNEDSATPQHHPKSVANAQVMLRFGGDDIHGRNRIETPDKLTSRHHYPIRPVHHHNHHLLNNEIRYPHYPQYMPPHHSEPPQYLPSSSFSYPYPPPPPPPPSYYYPGPYYPPRPSPYAIYNGQLVPVEEAKFLTEEPILEGQDFLGHRKEKNGPEVANISHPKILQTEDLTEENIPEVKCTKCQENQPAAETEITPEKYEDHHHSHSHDKGPVVFPSVDKKHNELHEHHYSHQTHISVGKEKPIDLSPVSNDELFDSQPATEEPIELKPVHEENEITECPVTEETTTETPISLPPVDKDLPISLPTDDKEIPISLPETDKELPISLSPVSKEMPVSISPVDKDLPISLSPVDKELPISLQPISKELPISLPEVDKELPISLPPVDKELPISLPPVDKELPISLPPVDKELPISLPPVDKELPISLPPVDKELPISLPPVDKELPISLPQVDKELPISLPPVDKESPISLAPVDKDLPISLTPVEKELPISLTTVSKDLPISLPPADKDSPISLPSVEKEEPISIPLVDEDLSTSLPSVDKDLPVSIPPVPEEQPISLPAVHHVLPSCDNEEPISIPADLKEEPISLLPLTKDYPPLQYVNGFYDPMPQYYTCAHNSRYPKDYSETYPEQQFIESEGWLNRSVVPYNCQTCGQKPKLLVSYPIFPAPEPPQFEECIRISGCPCCQRKCTCNCCKCHRNPHVPFGKRFPTDVDSLYQVVPTSKNYGDNSYVHWPASYPQRDCYEVTPRAFAAGYTSSSGSAYCTEISQVGNQKPKVNVNGYHASSGGGYYTDPSKDVYYQDPSVVGIIRTPDPCKPVVEHTQIEQPNLYKVVRKYNIVPKAVKPLTVTELLPTNVFVCEKGDKSQKTVCHREYLPKDVLEKQPYFSGDMIERNERPIVRYENFLGNCHAPRDIPQGVPVARREVIIKEVKPVEEDYIVPVKSVHEIIHPKHLVSCKICPRQKNDEGGNDEK